METVEQELLFVGSETGKLLAMRELVKKVCWSDSGLKVTLVLASSTIVFSVDSILVIQCMVRLRDLPHDALSPHLPVRVSFTPSSCCFLRGDLLE